MGDLELRHLRYLIAVAEAGSITRAAQRLLISQPALSRALRSLERTVGVPLLVRGPHSTGLTETGRALLDDAYEMLERSRSALARARGTTSAVETLTVTVPACDVVAVAAASRAFEAENPGVRVDLRPHDWTAPVDRLRAGDVDVSIMRDGFDRHDLVIEEIAREPRLVMLAAAHPLAAVPETLRLSDLRDEVFPHLPGMSPAYAEHWTGADVDRRPRRSGPEVHSVTDLLSTVVLGRAIALIHGSTLPAPELPGLRIREVEGLSASRLEIAVPARAAGTTAKQFVDHVCHTWPA
ncbi:LysR family transcriptional regulator [Catenuloplanes japonicus]|uniref:LysR family transcriptional regulator n=1 Tax=Catenuloplanes japonicus TaxID=33876 RepID=UPI000524808B|nr:LysR substrate-binding domain-containing protein [Catenuloplanes japonicus]